MPKNRKGPHPAMDRSGSLSPENRSPAEARRILVVDDELSMRKAVRRVLLDAVRHSSRARFLVDMAETAGEALALTTIHRYDAVITDYEMPRHNGVWLLERLKEKCPETFRVLHSGSHPRGLEKHVDSGVIQRIILKPAASAEFAELWG